MKRSVAGERVVVVGSGRSGVAAALVAKADGAREVVLNDQRPALEDALTARLLGAGVGLSLGGHPEALFAVADTVVLSPGVPPLDPVEAAAARGVRVIGELELGAWHTRAPVVAITGTNGKSTVTTLVGEMLAASGFDTFVGGNLGTPLCEAVGARALEAEGRCVLEVSSYQLETIVDFRPSVAVWLNLTPDHLDRYGNMAAYGAAKARIFLNQRPEDHAVVPGDDPLMVSFARGSAAQIHTYGAEQSAVKLSEDAIVDAAHGRYRLDALKIRGSHNVGNAMAAVLAARLAGATHEAIAAVLGRFPGLPHRMQFVASVGGVEYFDDSKATNVGAALKALEGTDRPVVLIAGGRDKGGSYEPLVQLLRMKGRGVVTLGEAAPLIESALGGAVPFERAPTMAAAVRTAHRMARAGDCVLLAPACSSLDMYPNYAARGRDFADAVRALEGGSQ
ncbi:MAG: UDP-N-acetylmuramoyl-L-alanine--D-glutamate ligase [Myxococcales bacterium]|nr:UDP-N-acetylmuramoyl-L-alanine--D-glutamate ligase [Myxococcales bacterium]